MQLISTFSKEVRFLLCVIDIFRKYPWVVLLKDKKGVTIVNAQISNKIWVNKGSELYIKSFKKWLKDNEIEMYSTHNE